MLSPIIRLINCSNFYPGKIKFLSCTFKDVVCRRDTLFKRLCRHYYFINKEAVFDYVNAYREMWDADSLNTAEQ